MGTRGLSDGDDNRVAFFLGGFSFLGAGDRRRVRGKKVIVGTPWRGSTGVSLDGVGIAARSDMSGSSHK